MSKLLRHYYHVYADGDHWQDIVLEHFYALGISGLLDKLSEPVQVVVIGPKKAQQDAQFLLQRCSSLGGLVRDYGVYHYIDGGSTGWEQATLMRMWEKAQSHDMRGAVLYAHTKGAAHPSIRQDSWRQRMTQLCIGRWEAYVDAIDWLDVDVAGAYHIVNDGEAQDAFGDGADIVAGQLNQDLGTTLEVGPVFPEVGQAIFAGNFWWADWSWIGSLNAPRMDSRYDAETWIGGVNKDGRIPTVFNMERWHSESIT